MTRTSLVAILSGARNHRDLLVSKKIYERMELLFPDQKEHMVAASILLANTYSSYEDHQQVSLIRLQNVQKYGRKVKPGVSWTEVDGEIVVSRSLRSTQIVHCNCFLFFSRSSKPTIVPIVNQQRFTPRRNGFPKRSSRMDISLIRAGSLVLSKMEKRSNRCYADIVKGLPLRSISSEIVVQQRFRSRKIFVSVVIVVSIFGLVVFFFIRIVFSHRSSNKTHCTNSTMWDHHSWRKSYSPFQRSRTMFVSRSLLVLFSHLLYVVVKSLRQIETRKMIVLLAYQRELRRLLKSVFEVIRPISSDYPWLHLHIQGKIDRVRRKDVRS